MTNTTWMDAYGKGVHGKQGKRYGEINDNKKDENNLFRSMIFNNDKIARMLCTEIERGTCVLLEERHL